MKKYKDPELKKTVNEMINVAKKNDMAAYIVVVSQNRCEFRLTFPNWGLIELNGNEIRFRSDPKAFDSKALQHKMIENSMHILMQFRDMFALAFNNTDELIKILEEKFEIEHKGFSDFEKHEFDD